MIEGLLIGFIFGFAFEKSKVFTADSIVGQFLFKKFTMLKVFLTAVMVSMLILAILRHFCTCTLMLRPLNLYTNILGGSILGIGLAISGACPGTVFAQVGSGFKDAIFTLLGALFGALVYGFYDESIKEFFSSYTLKSVSFFDYAHPMLLVFCIIALIALFLFLLEKFRNWREDLE